MVFIDYRCKNGGKNYNLKIKKVRILSIWIGHGSVAAVGSVVTGVLTGNTITHWWVEIETEESDNWYCAQFNKPRLELIHCSSLSQVTSTAINCTPRWANDPNISVKRTFTPDNNNLTMGQVANWMESYYDNEYHLICNNCQDFADKFCHTFSGQHASNNLFNAIEEEPGLLIPITAFAIAPVAPIISLALLLFKH